ncbi:MAG: hypothetical protein IPP57_28515 [Candidatus Obscuribacter sp.]|jgi:hypothetical protein|nr:hypothetical protein [Candidatus Obscuribacter sp.]MBK9621699.1 hypothetical protein [Candidatus Obscuribacter sp.]MBK9774723.1 hypothetical protein [Candidatus Obscuribacter sp.]
MDALRMRRKLHDLALEALLFDRALVPSDLAPVNVRALPLGLQKLAARYAGKQSLTVDAVLSQLFVSDVVEYLLSLPSCYWFWQVVLGATMLPELEQGEASLARLIGMEEVVRAVRELKQQQERDFDLALPLERLPAAQVDCRLAQGVLLNVEDDDGAVEVVPNPIFASPDLSKLH